MEFTELSYDPLQLPPVAHNAPDRCYHCKQALFTALREATPLPLCDGSNASDAAAHRPGRQALTECAVASPLAEAGLTKKEIYGLAAQLGMDNATQAPRPCLLTRLPYGMSVHAASLCAIAAAEEAVQRRLDALHCPADFRLRCVAPGRYELHTPAATLGSLPPPLRRTLERTLPEDIAHTAPDLGRVPLVGVDTLSGYFDQQQSLA